MDISPKIAILAGAIAYMEGFFSINSEAFRDKNPGGLEFVDRPGSYRRFGTIRDGFEALYLDLEAKRGSGLNLRQIIYSLCTPYENDNCLFLNLTLVCELTGFSPEEKL